MPDGSTPEAERPEERIQDLDIATELKQSYLQVRHERHRGPRAARRARRPQAEPAAHPRGDERPQPLAPRTGRSSAPRSSARRWATTTPTATRRSTRRWCAWPSRSTCASRSSWARATSAPSTATRPASMRYTECRMTQRGRRDARRPRQGDRRLPAQLRRVAPGADRPAWPLPQPARQRRRGHRRRDGLLDPAPQPLPRSPTPSMATLDNPEITIPRSWSTFPGRTSPRVRGSAGATRSTRPTPRVAPSSRCAPAARSWRRPRAATQIVITEIPYQVNKSTLIKKIADRRQERPHPGHLRDPRRVRRRTSASSSASSAARIPTSSSTSSTSTRRCATP